MAARFAQLQRRALRPVAAASTTGPLVKPVQPRSGLTKPSHHLRILSLLSQNVEFTARVQRFEELGGRAAMVGLAVALVMECAMDGALLPKVNAGALEAGALMVVGASAVLASVTKRPEGAVLLEAVMTSLTSGGRSAASVTQNQVDKALDFTFDQVFTTDLTHLLETLTDESKHME